MRKYSTKVHASVPRFACYHNAATISVNELHASYGKVILKQIVKSVLINS